MTNIQALREKISNLTRQAQNLLAEKGSATWTKEEQATFDNLTDEIERAQNQIKAEQRLRDLDAEKFFENLTKPGANPQGGQRDEGIDAQAAMALYMRFGNNVTPEQAVAIRNAMSAGGAPSEGGYTVPAVVEAMVIDAMKAFGGMREAARVIATEGGNPMSWPTSDGTAEVGEIVGENTSTNGQDVTFGTVGVNPYKYSSKKIALPMELIQDSAIDVVAFVVNRLATRLARITNQHYTTGTGTAQPRGLFTAATVGKVGQTGQTGTITYDDVIDLIHSVNVAYRRNAKFMLADSSLKVLRKMKDSTGRPLWNPGDNESIDGGAPSTLAGYAYSVNEDAPAMAANAKPVAFGDFSYYTIRDVKGSTTMRRFDDSAFALLGQVGFCGWTRTGGNLLDTNAVKLYQNSAS